MAYTIELRTAAQRTLRALEPKIRARIMEAIRGLAETPRPPGTMRLAGYDHWYRLRVGRYRVIYEVMDRIRVVTVIDVEHRLDVYQRLPWRRVETARGSILDRAVSFAPWWKLHHSRCQF